MFLPVCLQIYTGNLCVVVLPMGSDTSVLATQDPDTEEREQMETPIYEKYDHMLHGGSRKKRQVAPGLLTVEYSTYAMTHVQVKYEFGENIHNVCRNFCLFSKILELSLLSDFQRELKDLCHFAYLKNYAR